MEIPDHEHAIRVEQTATAAFADLCYAAPLDLVRTLKLETRTFASAIAACAPGWNTIHVNRVLGVGLEQPATETLLDELVTFYRPAHLQFAINLSPVAQPPAFPTWLAARGFLLQSHAAILVRGIQEPEVVHTNVHVTRIGSVHAATFAQMLVTAFPLPTFFAPWLAATVGRPKWHHYLAFDNDAAVAAAAMFVHEQTAMLYWSATLETYRRRGIQRTLIAQRIRDAIALGCTLITSDTEEDTVNEPSWSYRNLRRGGFRLLYLRPTYVLLHEA